MKEISLVKTLNSLYISNACFVVIINLLYFFYCYYIQTYKNGLFFVDHSFEKYLKQLNDCLFQSFDNLVVLVEN